MKLINHCEKHKRFIPTCKACVEVRDGIKKEDREEFLRQEMPDNGMPKDDKGKPLFHRIYEKVIIVPQDVAEVDQYFNSMHVWGYDFVTQLDFRPRVGDIILIFKKREV